MQRAGRILRSGGVVAYPTEGVYGLGCLPDNDEAVSRILDIKQRPASLGLILIAANPEQIYPWLDLRDFDGDIASALGQAVSWVVPAAPGVSRLITGDHDSIAVRVTRHAVANRLCLAADSPLVSTSANISGRRPARNAFVLRRNFHSLVDYIVPGACGPASGPSEIRDLISGAVLRPATK